MRFFTSDTHFGHAAVIDYCNRPFKDVEEMNEELIRRWNILVTDSDVVYHMGDFSFLNSTKTKEIVSRLRGTIVLIRGNHDKKPHRFFTSVFPNYFITLPSSVVGAANGEVKLSHYPYKGVSCDERDFSERQLDDQGHWLLHGHVHCEWKQRGRMINVGVDQWAYAPVSEQEIIDLISSQPRPKDGGK